MLDICVCGAACDNSECSVLGCLEFVGICVGDDGSPEGVSVFNDGSSDGFVGFDWCFFLFPQVVEASALTTLSDLSSFSLVILVYSAKLSFGSSVTLVLWDF